MKKKNLYFSAILSTQAFLFATSIKALANEEKDVTRDLNSIQLVSEENSAAAEEFSGKVFINESSKQNEDTLVEHNNHETCDDIVLEKNVYDSKIENYVTQENSPADNKVDVVSSVSISGWSEDGLRYKVNDNWISGEFQVNNKWYYFDSNNDNKKVVSSFVEMIDHNGSLVKKYFTEFGERKAGQAYLNGNYYFFDPEDGRMRTGEVLIPKEYNKAEGIDKWVYYQQDGSMKYGQTLVGDVYKYFNPQNGARMTGEVFIPKEYNKAEGFGKWVFYKEDGSMKYGQTLVGTNYKYFNPNNGSRMTGEVFIPKEYNKAEGFGKWVFYKEDGSMKYGQTLVNGYYKYFDINNGKRVSGLVTLTPELNRGENIAKTVYYDQDGKMVYGWAEVNNQMLYFSPKNGALVSGQDQYQSDIYAAAALYGIDISSWNSSLKIKDIKTDFTIIKATGGKEYVSSSFYNQINEALKLNKKIGLYHYGCEKYCPGTPEEEADHFYEIVKPYINRVALFLDFEEEGYDCGDWSYRFCNRIYSLTGVKPVIYSYLYMVQNNDWGNTPDEYPLGLAHYYTADRLDGIQSLETLKTKYNEYSYLGGWKKPIAIQYGIGYLNGYENELDLNVFYGSAHDWDLLCKPIKAVKV